MKKWMIILAVAFAVVGACVVLVVTTARLPPAWIILSTGTSTRISITVATSHRATESFTSNFVPRDTKPLVLP